MAATLETLQSLVKALEAGGYNAAPSTLVQGAALQTEDLSPVMNNVTYGDEHIKLQKMLKVSPAKSTTVQFDRQLSYGQWGGSAQLEGAVGLENTGDYVRIVVPMAFYSTIRRVTIVANMVNTVDGKKAEEREATNAAKLLAGDIEFDLFRGKDDFSNAGVFDGNPLAVAELPNMMGLGAHIRQSDTQRNAKDLMFAEYGSNSSVVISVGGVMSQSNLEDMAVRSAMNLGSADKVLLDPLTLSHYNKAANGKERIVLAGGPQDAQGHDFRRQWVSGGVLSLEASRFLSGKTQPAVARPTGPVAPSAGATSQGASTTAFTAGQVYKYYVTSVNEIGESVASNEVSATIAVNGNKVTFDITPSGSVRYFNVYRTVAGGASGSEAFIGRVANSGGTTTTFTDLGNKIPGFVTAFLVQGDTMEIREMAPYSRMRLAQTDLSIPEAHYRFLTLAVTQPRKNVIGENVS